MASVVRYAGSGAIGLLAAVVWYLGVSSVRPRLSFRDRLRLFVDTQRRLTLRRRVLALLWTPTSLFLIAALDSLIISRSTALAMGLTLLPFNAASYLFPMERHDSATDGETGSSLPPGIPGPLGPWSPRGQ